MAQNKPLATMGNPCKPKSATNSTDILVHINGRDATSILWVKVRNTVVHSPTHRTVPPEQLLAPKLNSAEVLKPWEALTLSLTSSPSSCKYRIWRQQVVETCTYATDTSREPACLRILCDRSQLKIAQAHCRGAGIGWQIAVDMQATQTA